MFGIVNCAIRDHVLACYGETTWSKVLLKSLASPDDFVSMERYSDEVTVSLLTACAEETGVAMEQTLEDIGQFWAEFLIKSDYGSLVQAAGKDLPDVLYSLDSLHTRLGLAFSEMKPPSFWCTQAAEELIRDLEPGYSALVLHYISERDGLAPMVKGIVLGLGRMLATDCRIEQIAFKHNGTEHDSFLVIYDTEVSNG